MTKSDLASTTRLKDFLNTSLPRADMRGIDVDRIGEGSVNLSLILEPDQLSVDLPRGSGQTVVSGPLMLGFGDTAMYAAVHASLGSEIFAVILSINTTFLRLAEPTRLFASAKILRQTRSVCFTESRLFSEGSKEPCAQLTASYAIKALNVARSEG